ncbi:MAG: pyroglutamyl-peptidase I, partial [Acetobacteraceae bacterium]|nr:pyroglutamyl-peptidase I [Acetobacteraceae bacterium]
SMSPRTLLLTAFEPFGGESVNASWEAARELEGWSSGEFAIAARRLPCVYDLCVAELARTFEALRPAGLMMTGQASRRTMVCVERIARNDASARTPDNRGVIRGRAAPASGPAWLGTEARVAQIARAIRDVGVPARVSTNAGDYVCNHLYYGALAFLCDKSRGTPAVFIHLPATPAQFPRRGRKKGLPTARAAHALEAAARAIMSP